jgi:hypothetical protein
MLNEQRIKYWFLNKLTVVINGDTGTDPIQYIVYLHCCILYFYLITTLTSSRMRRQNMVTGRLMTWSVSVGTLHSKLQTHFLVREDAIGKRKSNCQSKKEEKYKSGHGPQREARYQDELVDCLSAARRTPTPTNKLRFSGTQDFVIF